MYSTNTIELKGKRVEQIAGGALLLIGGYFVSPFICAALGGLAGLMVGAIMIITGYFLAPAIGKLLGAIRIKALKAIAAKYPIESLEAAYGEKKNALLQQRESIKQLIAVGSKIFAQIQGYESQFHKASPRRDSYNSLNQLIGIMKSRYENAQKNLEAYGQLIEEKRADWDIAQEMAKANKLANIGQDFYSKLMQDTALNTIQTGLDLAFAELDASVMDANVQKALNGEVVQVQVVDNGPVQTESKPKALLNAPTSDLDFDFNNQDGQQKVAVSARSRRN